jgi:hypothetical protein
MGMPNGHRQPRVRKLDLLRKASILPEIFEARRRQLNVTHGVGDVLVAEIVPQGTRAGTETVSAQCRHSPMAFHLPFYSYLKLCAEPTHILGPDQPNDEQKAKALILFQMQFSFSYLAVDTILKLQHCRLFRGLPARWRIVAARTGHHHCIFLHGASGVESLRWCCKHNYSCNCY